jgi:hypothetical protein
MSKKTNTADAPGTDVVTQQTADTNTTGTSALALPTELLQDFIDNAGAGLEDFSGSDFALPFISLLQKGSPQVDEADGKYVTGARPGMAFNTVTGETFDCAILPNRPEPVGLSVVVAAMQRVMVEWRPNQGGYVGQHAVDSPAHKSATPNPDKKSLLRLPNGNDLADTMYFYVILDLPEGPGWGVIAMKSTDLTEAKKWDTRIASQKFDAGNGVLKAAPMFGQSYILFSKIKENDFGSWMGWQVKSNGLVKNGTVFAAAKDYRKAVISGKAKATAPPEETAPADAQQGGGAGEDAPF